jgi:uncharacterized membrane protein
MDKRYGLIGIICGTCGIIGGILMIVAGFMENAFPRPLWFVAAICVFLNAIGIILNYCSVRRKEQMDTSEASK